MPIFLSLATATLLSAQQIPTPSEHLGVTIGADSVLADWSQINRYLSVLATRSPHVRLDTIGRSTLGRPLLLLTFGTPERLGRLDQLKADQARLADPRGLSRAAEDSLVQRAPAVVFINNNIHSTEIASSQMQLILAHRLATEGRYMRWLDSVVVLMTPSANPDGQDTVVSWYRAHKGTEYEGGPLPWLYHPYVGHDNNRDWFMLTQVETKAITRVLYEEWFPEVVWDVHQMGNRGARLFTPPFADPVNPNLDPMVVEAINLSGLAMGAAVLDAGKTGVAHSSQYDLWWHGGFRSTPTRHNMVGILTEAASARLASPIEQDTDSLRQGGQRVLFPAPWPGGWWRMGDIIEYELLAAEGLLQLVAAQRASFVRRFVTLGRRAIAAGESGNPFAFVIPAEQRDPAVAALLANTVIAAGVEVRRATAPFTAGGTSYATGSLIIPMAQPFRAHVKDLLEVQHYPGPDEPYDVAGWTLGLQMGVATDQIADAFEFQGARITDVAVPPGRVAGEGGQIVLRNRTNTESRAVVDALAAGARVWLEDRSVVVDGGPNIRTIIERHARSSGFVAHARPAAPVPDGALTRVPRIGLYKPWTASMDEGWTRWVLEQHGIPYVTVTDSMIRAGRLNQRLDVLIIPDVGEESIVSGRSPTDVPARFSGGIGEEGTAAIVAFVRAGGTLITLDSSSDFAISALNLPVVNIIAGQGRASEDSHFYAPGTIFGTALVPGSPITSGMGDSVAVYFADGRAFIASAPARTLARYAAEPFRSGYVRHPDRIAGRAALVEVSVERGRVVLFGFRPQHRGQTHATFKLLFNAALLSAAPLGH